ncbi:MAG: hypothetical protein U0599_27115 [Vicinamibacteria bacterium]
MPRLGQPFDRLVRLPLLAGEEGRRPVEHVLPVLEVEDREAPLGLARVVGREVDPHAAVGPERVRTEVGVALHRARERVDQADPGVALVVAPGLEPEAGDRRDDEEEGEHEASQGAAARAGGGSRRGSLSITWARHAGEANMRRRGE